MSNNTISAYNAGYDAWLQGKDLSWNMYSKGSAEYNAWINGYADAQAEDGDLHDPFTKLLAWLCTIIIGLFIIACVYFLVV